MSQDKTFTVKVCIDGKTTIYDKCDKEFIIDLINCPACEGKEMSLTMWNEAFADSWKRRLFENHSQQDIEDTANFFKPTTPKASKARG